MVSDDTPRIALVTGASRGLGHALANRLEAQGFLVIRAQRTVESVYTGNTGNIITSNCSRHVCVDLSNVYSVESFCEEIQSVLPYLDLLINNAAVCPREHTQENWKETLQTNFFSAVTITGTLLPLLTRRRGARVVNVSSSDGQLLFFNDGLSERIRGLHDVRDLHSLSEKFREISSEVQVTPEEYIAVGQEAYRLSKAGLNALTSVTARLGMNTVAICPGDIDTGMKDEDVVGMGPEVAVERMWEFVHGDFEVGGWSGKFIRDGYEMQW